jgi:hypothetical protein
VARFSPPRPRDIRGLDSQPGRLDVRDISLPPSAFRLPPSAFRLRPSAFRLPQDRVHSLDCALALGSRQSRTLTWDRVRCRCVVLAGAWGWSWGWRTMQRPKEPSRLDPRTSPNEVLAASAPWALQRRNYGRASARSSLSIKPGFRDSGRVVPDPDVACTQSMPPQWGSPHIHRYPQGVVHKRCRQLGLMLLFRDRTQKAKPV